MDTLTALATSPLALALILGAATVLVVAGPSLLLRKWLKTQLAQTRMGEASTLTTAAVIGVAIMALILLLVTFTMSYAALYEAADWLQDTPLTWLNGGDLRFLFPLGVDLVIVFFLILDLLMEWKHERALLNRFVVYVLSGATVALNVTQGDGLESYFTHAMPPLAVIFIAEGVATWIRHLAKLNDPDKKRDHIPFGRFLAHPLSTIRVARVMVGWQIRSYSQALELEMLCQACWALLRAHYGGRLRAHRRTPMHIRWLLGGGMQPATAYPLVVNLVQDTITFTPSLAVPPPPLRATDTPTPTTPTTAPGTGPTTLPLTPTATIAPLALTLATIPGRERPALPGHPPVWETDLVWAEDHPELWETLPGTAPTPPAPTPPAPAPERTTDPALARPAPPRPATPAARPHPVPVPQPPAPRPVHNRPAPAPGTDRAVHASLEELARMIDTGEAPHESVNSSERIRLTLKCSKKHANQVRQLIKEQGMPVAA